MYGSQTPMYESGGRTPHYGGQTPSHGEDGSRTPGRSGAWDPTITNTPSANRDYDDYSFEDTSPSPNYNPGLYILYKIKLQNFISYSNY